MKTLELTKEQKAQKLQDLNNQLNLTIENYSTMKNRGDMFQTLSEKTMIDLQNEIKEVENSKIVTQEYLDNKRDSEIDSLCDDFGFII